MAADPEQVIIIKRPVSNVVDATGQPIAKQIDLRTLVARRNILGVRVTVQAEAPPADSPPGTPSKLLGLVIVVDLLGRQIDVAMLEKFDGLRLDHFYAFLDHIAAILNGDVADVEIPFKTTNDFPSA